MMLTTLLREPEKPLRQSSNVDVLLIITHLLKALFHRIFQQKMQLHNTIMYELLLHIISLLPSYNFLLFLSEVSLLN